MTPIEALWYFINERHNIYLNKCRGDPWPWTDDKILQTYRFCNVFRELDTTTIWIRKNWREPYADHPNLPFAMAMARQINWTPTLEEIGFPDPWNPEEVERIMRARKLRKEKTYTSAYMLTGTLGGTKTEQTVFKILNPLYMDPIHMMGSLEETWKMYLPRPGFSGFMAYEVVTDLRHTKHLENATDIMTWANAGPGAVRGLNRIHGRKLNQPLRSKEQARQEMRALLMQANSGLRGPIHSHVPTPLEMRDIEHCLCETDKYLRAYTGTGRPRQLYKSH